MIRFAIFVDGSNLIGSLNKLNLKIEDYQEFYRHIFEESLEVWKQVYSPGQKPTALLHRVYWYQVGSVDRIDLNDAKFQAYVKDQFDKSQDIKKLYLPLAGQKLPGRTQEEIHLEAWKTFFDERRDWLHRKLDQLEKMKQFNYGVQSSCNFVEIVAHGHWKVDFVNKYVSEKGIDTSFAVDLATRTNHYDVALLISGDADAIPSVHFAKDQGKHVGVIDLIKGYPPERKGRQFSSRLQLSCDFVSRIYEMNLVHKKIGRSVSREDEV